MCEGGTSDGRPACHGHRRPSPEPELHDAEDDLQVVSIPGAQAARVVEQRGLQELTLPLVKHLQGGSVASMACGVVGSGVGGVGRLVCRRVNE